MHQRIRGCSVHRRSLKINLPGRCSSRSWKCTARARAMQKKNRELRHVHLHRLRFGRGERYRCGAHSALFAASCCLFQRFFGRLRFKATPLGIVQRVRRLCRSPEFSAWRRTREIKLVKPRTYTHNGIYNISNCVLLQIALFFLSV